MTRRGWGPLAVAIAAIWSAIPTHGRGQAPRSCVVLHDVSRARTTRTDDEACRTRLSPASTFKIPHALVALETNVVTPKAIERWDHTPYRRRPSWERNHTVLTAISSSVVWFFQRIAPRIGADRMHDWLVRLGYGNADTSGPVTEYWLNGRLRVSPDEQVTFLRRFYGGELPFSGDHVHTVQSALVQSPGRVQNSTGLHRLEGAWRRRIVLNAKTGAARTDNGEAVSWLVGSLSVDARQYVFAAAVWRVDGAVDQLDGARLAVDTFLAGGLLPKAPRQP